jgi:hypothetical protein
MVFKYIEAGVCALPGVVDGEQTDNSLSAPFLVNSQIYRQKLEVAGLPTSMIASGVSQLSIYR